MTLTKDRHIGRYIHPDGLAVELTTVAGAETLVDGQIQPVTDGGRHNIFVRKGGDLLPASDQFAAQTTEEELNIQVDWATGTSPPAGTRVTNQAQVDALGTLKYLSDVFRILPIVIGNFVKVSVAAGTHYRDPDYATAYGGLHALLPPYVFGVDATELVDFTTPYFGVSIIITGEYSTYDAGIAGTTTYSVAETKFTRTAGTWTVDELKDKTLEIVSGSGAGTKGKILSNTATEVIVAVKLSSPGACTVDILDHATIFDAKDGPAGTPATRFIGGPAPGEHISSVPVLFNQVQVGTSSEGLFGSANGSLLWFYDCTVYGSFQVIKGYYAFQRCLVDTPSGDLWHGINILRRAWGDLNDCIIRVNKSDAGIALLDVGQEAFCWIDGGYLDVAGSVGFTAAALKFSRGARADFTSPYINVLGNGINTGVVVEGNGSLIWPDDMSVLNLVNCDVGINVTEAILNISGIRADTVNTMFQLSNRASVKVGTSLTLSNITDYADIDGEVFDESTYFSNRGDAVTGQYGSKLERG